MIKVLLVTNIPAPYRVDLFYYLQNNIKNYEISVLYSAMGVDNREWKLDENKIVNTYFVDSKIIARKNKYDTSHVFIPMNIISSLNMINPDVLIAWEYGPVAILSWLWCKRKKKKFINLTDGTLFSERNINIGQKLSRKIIISHCDAAIASSTMAKEKLIKWGIDEKKVFLSFLTVDVQQWQKVKKNIIHGRILYVGSMIERKGLDLLVNALGKVKAEFELHIVGNGTKEELSDLYEHINSVGISEKVKVCGFMQGTELSREYEEAEIFVLPTREDCFGLVLVEALCAGVPIITSKYADGAYDTVENGNNGLIIDPYDTTAFAESIEGVLYGKIQLNGTQKHLVEQFKFDNVSKGYVHAIKYVLGNV